MSGKPQTPILDRFWQKVEKRSTECWEWIGARNVKGYGSFRSERGTEQAHRFSYRMFVGEIPEGLLVLHSCDNPPCVNPRHLSTGTSLRNMQEMMERGRKPTKLSPQEVVEVFLSPRSGRALGAEYRVSQTMIRYIKSGQRWSGITASLEAT